MSWLENRSGYLRAFGATLKVAKISIYLIVGWKNDLFLTLSDSNQKISQLFKKDFPCSNLSLVISLKISILQKFPVKRGF